MTDGSDIEPDHGDDPALDAPKADPAGRPPSPKVKKHGHRALWLRLSVVFLALLIGFGVMGLTGKPISLPVWAVAEVESRMNRALGDVGGASVSVDAIDITVDSDWVPRLRMADVRFAGPTGSTLLVLPEARITFDPSSLLRGSVHARSVALLGATVKLRRDTQGRFDLQFGTGTQGPQLASFAALLDAVDKAFSLPALAHLQTIQAEGLSLTLEDARANRVWQVGDGRLTLENRPTELAAELGLTVTSAGQDPAQAVFSFVTQKSSSAARIRATVDRVAARDIAAQAPPLAFLGVLDAPISGKLTTEMDANGFVSLLDGTLTLDKGALHPNDASRPVAFDRAALSLSYDPVAEKISLNEVTVESPSLRLLADGQVYIPGVTTGAPQEFLAQVHFDQVKVDPEGLFQEPVTFSEGALDLRLRLDPFRIDLGQLALVEDDRHLIAKGKIAADPNGWNVAVDLALDDIRHDRLLALWPVALVPKTRAWLVDNVQEGQLSDVKAAVRLAPGAEPRLSLGYEFADTDVRFLKTLPPIKQGHGYATIEGNSYTMVVDQGHVTPPKGGMINMAGTVFAVLDILQKPAQAEINLHTDSSLTAALSLLDEPPFRFMTKAGQSVELGQGRAVLDTVLRLPLIPKVLVSDVSYQVNGRLTDVTSDVLVPGRTLTAANLTLTASPAGLRISGKGKLGSVPFDATYVQGFGPAAKGKASVEGQVELSPTTVEEFNLGLPTGMVSGTGSGQITVALQKGAAPRLRLTSDLARITLKLPEVGWTKPANIKARLEVDARLGAPATIDALLIEGPGLRATGQISLRAAGGLDTATFNSFTVADWLKAGVKLTGRGKGRAPAVALSGGVLDLRRMTLGGSAGGQAASDGAPLDVSLDRVTVSEGIALTAFRGKFTPRGGFNGSFTARVNGGPPVSGTVVPSTNGSAVRITSDNAGAVLKAAGIFDNARGGSLDLQLVPRREDGSYNGRVSSTAIRVQNAPALAELLSAISVVGILEKLNGAGLTFNDAQADFRMTPDAIEITRGSAVGASLGVSAAGLYSIRTKAFDMQGVVSPIYLLNGIGAVLTRRGEGLFGFNYKLRGTADDPKVSVNPLSILTPGMFRELFRRAPPTLEGQG